MKKTLLTMCAFTVISACADLVGPEVRFGVMGGNFRKDGLRLDLEAIRAAGFSGVHFFHIHRPDVGVWPGCEEQIPCLSEKWDDMVAFLGEECERLGLALTGRTVRAGRSRADRGCRSRPVSATWPCCGATSPAAR